MGDLSEHFSKFEFADPVTGEVTVSPRLVAALEHLRVLARVPLRILSGYRSAAHNAAVGGRPGSRHLTGEAADLQIDGLSLLAAYALAEQVPEFQGGGIGIYPAEDFIHVDVRQSRARWARLRGEYVSISLGIRAA